MKSRSVTLFEKSVSVILASIEVYNKPDSFYREENYSILAVNAWELLLKARILQLSSNSLSSIAKFEYKLNKSGIKSKVRSKVKNRSGNIQTISIFKAFDLLNEQYEESLDESVRLNLEALVEIRDNSIHFINKGLELERRVLEIGTASLENYILISRQWFGRDLSAYNIFLMPLAFVREDITRKGIVLNNQERNIEKYLNNVDSSNTNSTDFNTSIKIEINLKRSKNSSAHSYRITDDKSAPTLRLTEENIRETYPWSYKILVKRLGEKLGDKFKQNCKFHAIKKKLEANRKLCNERLLDPSNPKSTKMKFYSPNILKEFIRLYTED